MSLCLVLDAAHPEGLSELGVVDHPLAAVAAIPDAVHQHLGRLLVQALAQVEGVQGLSELLAVQGPLGNSNFKIGKESEGDQGT